MVTIQQRIKRLPPSTVDGETFVFETIYTSYNKTEIDWIEKNFKDSIGTGLIGQFELKEQKNEHID
jgi:hypothetical protein